LLRRLLQTNILMNIPFTQLLEVLSLDVFIGCPAHVENVRRYGTGNQIFHKRASAVEGVSSWKTITVTR